MPSPTSPPFDPAAAAATSSRPAADAKAPGTDGPAAGAANDFRASVDSVRAAATSAIGTIGERLGEIREFAGYYVDTKTDAVKVKLTTYGIYAGLGVVGGIVGVAALATAGVLIVRGMAEGLGAAFGHQWLGDLVTGLGLVLLLAVGGLVTLKILTASFKRKMVAKYEQRRQDQRSRFGTDVHQRGHEVGYPGHR